MTRPPEGGDGKRDLKASQIWPRPPPMSMKSVCSGDRGVEGSVGLKSFGRIDSKGKTSMPVLACRLTAMNWLRAS